MAKIQRKKEKEQCRQGFDKMGNTYLLLMGVQTGAASDEISMKVPEVARNRSTIYMIRYITFRLYQKTIS